MIEKYRKHFLNTYKRSKIKYRTFPHHVDIVKKWVEEININDDGSVNIKVKIPEGEKEGEEDQIFYVADNVLQDTGILGVGLKFEEVIKP